jgi:AcrR family transcriptional regulator
MTHKQYHHGDLKNALIKAGTEILSEEGVAGLSLRKVAARAGVSHSAPYAHFSDKQALIAAISTEGFRQLNARLSSISDTCQAEPARLLLEVAFAYVQFALDSSAFFKLMFSGVLEKEKDYPDFVAISKASFQLLVALVQRCQQVGLIRPGDPDVLAVSIWSLVHGFTALLLERQISSHILDRFTIKALLCQTLNQVVLTEIQLAETD